MRNDKAAKEKTRNWIWGQHSVEAALECHPELVTEVFVDKSYAGEMPAAWKDLGIAIHKVPKLPAELAVHRTQGIAALLKNFPFVFWQDFREGDWLNGQIGSKGQAAILDGVEDPRNFGAILRSAAAFGIKAIFVAARGQAPLTGVVAQASAGQLFRVPVVICNNLKQVIEASEGEADFLALAAGGEVIKKALSSLPRGRPLFWVLGSEGEGVRPTLAAQCTKTVCLPMEESVESLNVSVAAALAFYEGMNFTKS